MIDPPDDQLDEWFAELTARAPMIAATEHRYGDHPEQRADLRLPPGSRPCPAVVVIHGGAFRGRYDRHMMTAMAVDLTLRGYATWNIEYRRTDRDGGPHTTPADVAAAIEFLASGSVSDRIDLDRLVVLGHSSGGYLALRAANLPLVHRVIALGAVCDLRRIATTRTSPYAQFAGGMPADIPDTYDDLDLTAHFPTGSRIVLRCGASDTETRRSENGNYAAAARAAGEDIDYAETPQCAHFGYLDPDSTAWHSVADLLANLTETSHSGRKSQP